MNIDKNKSCRVFISQTICVIHKLFLAPYFVRLKNRVLHILEDASCKTTKVGLSMNTRIRTKLKLRPQAKTIFPNISQGCCLTPIHLVDVYCRELISFIIKSNNKDATSFQLSQHFREVVSTICTYSTLTHIMRLLEL